MVYRLSPVDDAATYFASPAGRILARDRFFCSSPDGALFALFAWGDLTARDTDQLTAILHASMQRRARLQLVDLTQVTRVSPMAMARFVQFYARNSSYARTVAREAVVRPDGLVGMLAEGFYPMVPLPFPGKVVRSTDAGLTWLGSSAPRGWRDAVAQELAVCAQRPAAVHAAVAHIVRLGAQASVEQVAHAVGVSERTLQRRLRAAGTTFEQLRTTTLVAEAERRLAETSDDIKQIALDLGYRTPARLTEAFTRIVGRSPSRYRDDAEPPCPR